MHKTFGSTPLYTRTLFVLFVLPLIAGLLLVALQVRDARAADEAAAARSAILIARSFASVDAGQLEPWLSRQVAGDDMTRPLRSISISEAGGKPIASAGPVTAAEAVFATASSPEGLTVRVSIAATDRRALWLRGLALTLLVSLAGTAGYVIATRPIVFRLVNALDGLTHAINSYRQSNFSARVREQGFGRVRRLERDVNRMAAALSASEKRAATSARTTEDELQSTLEEVEIKNVELDLARKRAVQDAQDKARFLANMSHEIRTPMNAIVGYAQLLESTALDSAQRGYLEHIDQSSRTLLTIIDDILNLSRLEAGRMAFDVRQFEIREVVAHAVDMLAPQAYSKSLKLRTRIEPDVPVCFSGDPGRIRQVLANFLSNAVKFTDRGLVEVLVSVKRQTDHAAILHIGVHDTGRGISREDRQRLFEPFTESSRHTEGGGAGLGLTIARALTHAMGGELSLQSGVATGSTFTARLPLETDFDVTFDFLRVLDGVDVALAVDDPALQEDLAAHFEAAGARVLITDTRPGVGAWPDARFVVFELSPGDAAAFANSDAAQWQDTSPTPVAIVPSVDRKLLQSVATASRGLALPAHADATHVLAHIARRLGAQVPSLGDAGDAPVLPDVRGARVLVADDDGLSRRYLEELLQRHGAQVTVCADGAQAVTMGRKVRYDAIFLDARMPELNGEDAARRLRASDTNRATPMIALTASALTEDRARLKAAGFDECLLKPAPVAALLRSVRRGLDSTAPTPAPNVGKEGVDHPFTALELCTELRRYRDAFARVDSTPDETAELAHRLRGAAAVGRLERLEARAANLEAAARAQHAEAMLLARSALNDALEETIGSLAPEATRH